MEVCVAGEGAHLCNREDQTLPIAAATWPLTLTLQEQEWKAHCETPPQGQGSRRKGSRETADVVTSALSSVDRGEEGLLPLAVGKFIVLTRIYCIYLLCWCVVCLFQGMSVRLRTIYRS